MTIAVPGDVLPGITQMPAKALQTGLPPIIAKHDAFLRRNDSVW
jgi:hypothetical protein